MAEQEAVDASEGVVRAEQVVWVGQVGDRCVEVAQGGGEEELAVDEDEVGVVVGDEVEYV
ncbi:MAG: hypothetical protein ACRC35_00875 [Angustibacter sp.]